LLKVALIARPAEIRAGRSDVNLFIGEPADVADVGQSAIWAEVEAIRVAQTVGPDFRDIRVGIARVERIAGDALSCVGDVEDLSAERVKRLRAQGQRIDGVEAGTIARGIEQRAIRGEAKGANRMGRVFRGDAVRAGGKAFAGGTDVGAEDYEFGSGRGRVADGRVARDAGGFGSAVVGGIVLVGVGEIDEAV